MPTMETFKEMGVNFDKFEEFDIEKMKCRGEGMYLLYMMCLLNIKLGTWYMQWYSTPL